MRSNPSTRSPKLILTGCIIVLLHAITSQAFCQNLNIKAELRHRFQGKTFLIQGGYQDEDLTYDSSGTIMGTPKRGSWTESAVKIDSIKVRRKEFILKGSRGGYAYDRKAKKFVPLIAKKFEVTIAVQAAPATLTSANLDELQNAIFTQNPKTDDLPDYWRDFMIHGEQDPAKKAPNDATTGTVLGVQSNSQPVFIVGDRVTPPRFLNHNEPEFTETARHARYQGTVALRAVLDDQGQPTQIKIMRALGMGLDDQAVKTVQQWRFNPAKRDGNPVAVIVDIEVNFRLN